VKWERLTVIIRFNHQTGKIRETIVRGEETIYAPDEQITIQEFLRELGRERWELMGIVGTDTYLFSRRVIED
jgi:hypothetical protein